jgi:hypothetical protein
MAQREPQENSDVAQKKIQLRLEKKIKQLKQNNNDTDNYPSEQKKSYTKQ